MLRNRGKEPLLTVAQIFNKVQEGVSGHSKYAKLLWDVHEANAALCWRDFSFCLDHLLTLPQASCRPFLTHFTVNSHLFALARHVQCSCDY